MASTTNVAKMAALKIKATLFIESIIFVPKLEKIQQASNFQQFNENIDPKDDLYYYKQKLAFDTNHHSILCKVFPISLNGSALNWLNWICSLQPNSIKNFHDLCTQFLTNISTIESNPKPPHSSLTLNRRKIRE